MIKEFQGEYRWLSNFAIVPIKLDSIVYKSVEHAYMSCKSDDYTWKLFCRDTERAGDVKKASYKIKLVDNWDQIKLDVMKECLKQKFSNEPYKTKLIQTNDELIQEGNDWNDKFWGVCLKTGKGENNLGKMIMNIRNELRG
jgi:ribA/ribD-fused uncharacterized protein